MRCVAVPVAVLCVTFAFAHSAAAATMFANSGFETGDFAGWTVGGNAVSGVATEGTPITGTLISDNVVDAFTGDFAAFAKFQGGDSPTTLTLEQTVDVEPGVPYQIVIRRGVFGSGDYRWTNELKVTQGNSSGSIGGGFHIGPMWSTVTVGTYTFPAGQTSATFQFEFGGYESTTRGLAGFSIDDITIREVPEPSGLGVISVAAVSLLSRRRPRARAAGYGAGVSISTPNT